MKSDIIILAVIGTLCAYIGGLLYIHITNKTNNDNLAFVVGMLFPIAILFGYVFVTHPELYSFITEK